MTQNDVFGDVVYCRTYARWLETEQRRETWEETAQRYRNYFTERFKLSENMLSDFNIACDKIKHQEIVPSMRCLWTAGKALDVSNIAGFNCTYILIDNIKSWADLLFLLMNGCGVGYSVERQVIVKLPEVPAFEEPENTTDAWSDVVMQAMYNSDNEKDTAVALEMGYDPRQDEDIKDNVVVFQDSKLGWAQGLLEYMTLLYDGKIPKYDLSLIRPKGARLKTFGGKAGGSDDLRLLLDYLKIVFTKASGRRLSSLECHDICCYIANVVVSAGIRRSACICLSNLSDTRMRDCKTGEFWKTNPQRQMCNNSVSYTEKPDMHIFMNEWMSLMNSGSGERGIFNRESATKTFESIGRKTKDSDGNKYQIGCNPCVTGDTLLLTDKGHFPIKELVGTAVSIWNGREFSDVVPFSTGENTVYNVHLSNGISIKCTDYHDWMINDGKFAKSPAKRVKTTDLSVGDKLVKYNMPVIDVGINKDKNVMYSLGFYAGDGSEDMNISYLYDTKYCCENRLIGKISTDGSRNRKRWQHGYINNKFEVPLNGTLQDKLEWFAGILDSDGCIVKNPNSVGVQISSIVSTFLRDIRTMLTTVGVQCKIVNGQSEHRKLMPDGKGGQKEYICKADERITLSAADVSILIELGLKCSRLDIDKHSPNRNASRFVTIVSVEATGYDEETFCVTEPKNHTATFNGIVTGQCGEIFLRPNQACNLSEVIVRPEDTLEDLADKVRSATVLGCMQSCLTDIHFLGPEWKENMEEERLLGVSLTGVRDHPVLNKCTQLAATWLRVLRRDAKEVAERCAGELGINVPAAITCVKPSGTTSSLVNSASGIHTRFAPYYIRRIRVSTTDSVFKFLKGVGVPYHPEVGQEPETANTCVFDFPVKSPDDSIFDTPALEQLDYWRMYKVEWCDHNPSVTIMVEENEWMAVGSWVYENWDLVGGLSFLPKSDNVYQLAPYEAITEEKYHKLVSEMPNIDFTQLELYESDDETTGAKEYACTGGSCDVI